MLDRIWAFIAAKLVGFKKWLVKVTTIEAGPKKRWPGFLNLIPGVNKGYDFATTGEAFVLVILRDYVVGTVKYIWGKLTAVPTYLFSPVLSFNESGYTWTTLVLNIGRWLSAKLRLLLELLRRLL